MKKYFSSYWIRSAFYTILQRFSITLFGLVNFMVLIRSLTKEQMGIWALFLVVTTIFETTKSGLLKNAHVRYVSGSPDSRDKSAIASSSLLINGAITAVFILFLLFFADWMSAQLHSGKELADMLRWFIPGLIGMVFFSHLEAIQQSHLDFKGVFAGYFIRQIAFFTFILVHAILKIPFSLPRLALYQSICIGIGTLVILYYSRPYLHYRFDPTKAWTRSIFGYGGYIFSSGIVANMFSNLDQLMTAKFLTAADVSYYSAAFRVNQLIDIPSYAAAEVIFPKVSKASAEEGDKKVLYLFERMVAILLCFTIPTGLFIIIFPKFIITIIAGSRYTSAALILQLYMLAGILRPFQNQAANLLNSIGKSALCFYINAASLAVNLVVNFLCLKYIGFYGAAIGTVITCFLGMTAWYLIMQRQIKTNLGRIIVYMIESYQLIYKTILSFLKPQNVNS
ncbi:MAG: oligosaccharide flippase family protein [Bacteroidetes bacterium]|nr:oligosaccharide flippase family protein [Bacteroidota bacterium]